MAYSQFKRIAEDALKKTFAEIWSTSAHSHVCYVFNSFWNRFMRVNKTPVITVYCISTRGWSFYAPPPPKKIKNKPTLIKRRCSPMTSWLCDTWKAKTNYCSPLESSPYANFNHCLITVDSQLFNAVTKALSLTYTVIYPEQLSCKKKLKFEKSIRQFFIFLFFHFTT